MDILLLHITCRNQMSFLFLGGNGIFNELMRYLIRYGTNVHIR